MNLNPTWTVLSSMQRHKVRCLLMGGQACVFYGAAEFSRDVDFAILPDEANLIQLRAALLDLQAEPIAVPPFKSDHLHEGLAIHFRCGSPGVEGLRVDIMSVLRGVDAFEVIWERRTTIEVEGLCVDLLSLPDLVASKKTQRAKDWPMLQRLVEANWFQNRNTPTKARIDFWLKECRTPELLIELAARFSKEATAMSADRPVLCFAKEQNLPGIERELDQERLREIEADKQHWAPLKRKLELLRSTFRNQS